MYLYCFSSKFEFSYDFSSAVVYCLLDHGFLDLHSSKAFKNYLYQYRNIYFTLSPKVIHGTYFVTSVP